MKQTEPKPDAAARRAAQPGAEEPPQPARAPVAQPQPAPLMLAALKSGPINRDVVLKLIDGVKLL